MRMCRRTDAEWRAPGCDSRHNLAASATFRRSGNTSDSDLTSQTGHFADFSAIPENLIGFGSRLNVLAKSALSAVVLQEMRRKQSERGMALLVELRQRFQRAWQPVRPALPHRLWLLRALALCVACSSSQNLAAFATLSRRKKSPFPASSIS